MNDDTPSRLESSLNDAERVRAIARRLLGDDQDADDVMQDTALAALRHGAAPGTMSVPWLRTVAKRFAFMDLRRGIRRDARERAAAKSERCPSTAELVERADMHRVVVQAVLDLEEPYRSTVLQRYFADRSAEDIARDTGVPAATVRSRLMRALSLLRQRLRTDRQYGDWRAGLLLLLGLNRPAPVLAARSINAAWTPYWPAFAALVLVTVTWPVARRFLADDRADVLTLTAATQSAKLETTPRRPSVGTAMAALITSPSMTAPPARLQPIPETVIHACGLYVPPTTAAEVRIAVVDDVHRPIPQATIRLDGVFVGTGDADGRWSMSAAARGMWRDEAVIEIDHPDFAPVRRAMPRDDAVTTVTLGVAARLVVDVIGPQAVGIAGAAVYLVDEVGGRELGTTDSRGRLSLDRLTAGIATLKIRSDGHARWESVVTLRAACETTCRAELSFGRTVTVRVVDKSGKPVSGVASRLTPDLDPDDVMVAGVVRGSTEELSTDSLGEVSFEGVPVTLGAAFVALRRGGSASTVTRRVHLDGAAGSLHELVLVGGTLEVALVDPHGTSISGQVVVVTADGSKSSDDVPAGGAATFGPFDGEDALTIEVHVHGRRLVAIGDVMPRREGPLRVTVEVPELFVVGIGLQDAAGAAVLGDVLLTSRPRSTDASPGQYVVTTDPDGWARGTLPRGDYGVDVFIDGRQVLVGEPLSVEDVTKRVLVIHDRRTATGRLRDRFGAPLRHWAVTAVNGHTVRSGRTDEAGQFTIDGLSDARWDMFGTPPATSGEVALATGIVPGQAPLDLVADVARLRVSVVDFTTGKPARLPIRFHGGLGLQAQVTAQPWPPTAAQVPDGNGEIVLEVPAGAWWICPEVGAAQRCDAVLVNAPAGDTTTVELVVVEAVEPKFEGPSPEIARRLRWRATQFGRNLHGEARVACGVAMESSFLLH